METVDFFSTSPKMRGYSGDTFPLFRVNIWDDTHMELSECTMRIVLEIKNIPGSVAFTKSCTYVSDSSGQGYNVRLDSSETAALCGVYTMHFILTDPDGREYRKLVGTLEVLPVPDEGA